MLDGKVDDFSNNSKLCSWVAVETEVPDNEGGVDDRDKEVEGGYVEVIVPVDLIHGHY